jgi:hypothetical protein
MTAAALRERLITRGLAARYDLFFIGGLALAVVGLALFGFAISAGHSERAWHLFQVNWLVFTGLTGGSLAFTASHKIANAKWSGVIIRFSQATIFFGVVSIVGLILIFTLGYESIYGRMHEQLPVLSPGKAWWLSRPVMGVRLLIALVAMFGLGWAMIRADLVPDVFLAKGAAGDRRAAFDRMTQGFDGSDAARARQHARINRLAGGFAPVYALAMTIIAFDGIMALQPHWFSNLLGGFYFMGSYLGAHTLLTLLVLYGRRHLGIVDLVSAKQRHDLGKLMFGFTVFWAYLMWAQFLVIWYGNLPEETGFVFARLWGPWMPVGRFVLIGMFIVPFWGLLFVVSKKTPFSLGLFAAVSLVSLWIERYLLVLPSVTKEAGPVFGLPELGPTLLLLGLFLFCYALFARRYPMISPRLAEITLGRELHHLEASPEYDHEERPSDFAHPKELES